MSDSLYNGLIRHTVCECMYIKTKFTLTLKCARSEIIQPNLFACNYISSNMRVMRLYTWIYVWVYGSHVCPINYNYVIRNDSRYVCFRMFYSRTKSGRLMVERYTHRCSIVGGMLYDKRQKEYVPTTVLSFFFSIFLWKNMPCFKGWWLESNMRCVTDYDITLSFVDEKLFLCVFFFSSSSFSFLFFIFIFILENCVAQFFMTKNIL